MKEQRVLILNGLDGTYQNQEIVNDLIKEGWWVTSVTAQHVASSNPTILQAPRGGFFIVLERIIIE